MSFNKSILLASSPPFSYFRLGWEFCFCIQRLGLCIHDNPCGAALVSMKTCQSFPANFMPMTVSQKKTSSLQLLAHF